MTMHLEEDAANVLQYMASNGLIANASKTSLVILNLKSNKSNSGTNLIKVKIGEEYVNQEKSAKLLGISFNEKQNWKDQIYGKNGVIRALNKLMTLPLGIFWIYTLLLVISYSLARKNLLAAGFEPRASGSTDPPLYHLCYLITCNQAGCWDRPR